MTYRSDATSKAAAVLHTHRNLFHRAFWHGAHRRGGCPDCWLTVYPAIEEALPILPPERVGKVGSVTVNVTADTSLLQEQLRRAADALRDIA